MIKQHIILTLALAGSMAITHAAGPAFFAMDTGTRDAKHKTPEEQVALVQEVGFAGFAPIYRSPEMLRETLDALDRRKLKMSAVYVPLNLDTPDPISPAIRDTIEQLRGRDSVGGALGHGGGVAPDEFGTSGFKQGHDLGEAKATKATKATKAAAERRAKNGDLRVMDCRWVSGFLDSGSIDD